MSKIVIGPLDIESHNVLQKALAEHELFYAKTFNQLLYFSALVQPDLLIVDVDTDLEMKTSVCEKFQKQNGIASIFLSDSLAPISIVVDTRFRKPVLKPFNKDEIQNVVECAIFCNRFSKVSENDTSNEKQNRKTFLNSKVVEPRQINCPC